MAKIADKVILCFNWVETIRVTSDLDHSGHANSSSWHVLLDTSSKVQLQLEQLSAASTKQAMIALWVSVMASSTNEKITLATKMHATN